MSGSSRLVKDAVALAFRVSPLPALIRAMRRQKATIIVYHNPQPVVVERHLNYLAARFSFVSLSQLVAAMQSKDWSEMPRNPLVVTFDDGHRNNHKLRPLFAKWQVRPTIFLCSHLINTRRGYWWRSGVRDVETLKRLPYAQFLSALRTQAHFSLATEYSERQALNLEELQAMAPHVEFGSHTMFHPVLPNCPDEICRKEIAESKQALEKLLGRSIQHFAFPNGDYGKRELDLLRHGGYASARTLDFGWNGIENEIFGLKAMEVEDDAGCGLLCARVHGLFPWLRYLKKQTQATLRRLTPRHDVIMLGPYPLKNAQGGISSVIVAYKEAGILTRHRIKYISTSSSSNHLVKTFAFGAALLRFTAEAVAGSARIVHIHSASWRSFKRKAIFLQLARLLRKKILLHVHGGEFQHFFDMASDRQKIWIRLTLERANLVCTVSQSLQTQLRKAAALDKVVLLPNPVDHRKYAPASSDSKAMAPTVLFLGRLSKEKGAFDLIKAARMVAGRVPDAQFRVCGPGDIEACKRICQSSALVETFEFPGWVQEAEKLRELRRAWVFVLPSYNEGLPVSILEAMAAGLPVVATAVGGIPELVKNGSNGLLVSPGNIEQLAEALTRLLTQPGLRARMGQINRRKIIQRYDVEVASLALGELYREIEDSQKNVALSENNSKLVELEA